MSLAFEEEAAFNESEITETRLCSAGEKLDESEKGNMRKRISGRRRGY